MKSFLSYCGTTLFVCAHFCAAASAAAAQGEARSANWHRGNTHAHTLNSDGDSTPDDVARWFREHGYQFVFITDHGYVTDVRPLNEMFGAGERFLVLPGQEVTQSSDDPTRALSRATEEFGAPAHINALFSTRVIEPIGEQVCHGHTCGRNSPASMPIGKTFKPNIDAIHADGAIAQINHPNGLMALRPEDLAEVPSGVLLEIWNATDPLNAGGDDGAGNVIPSTEVFWDWLLSRGKIVWGVGSDDSHQYRPSVFLEAPKGVMGPSVPGRSWIMVRAGKLTPDALKTAIRNGEFYASNGVALKDIARDDVQLNIVIQSPSAKPAWSPRYRTDFIGRDGAVLASVAGLKAAYRFKGSETYVRAVITDSIGKKAWTQPVFLDARKASSPYGGRPTEPISQAPGKS